MSEVNILRVLERSIAESSNLEGMSDEAIVLRVSVLFELVRADCKNSSIESYRESSNKNLTMIRAEIRGFEERTFLRWKPAFDHLELIWIIAQELGEAHGKDVLERNEADNNVTMAALAHIFPKALLVAQETICLLKGGYPDGALTRWRSLHELSVAAKYISKHGEKAAMEYLLSFHFTERRAALQMNKCSERTGLSKFSDEELCAFDARCEEAERLLDRKVVKDRDGEWPKISGKNDFSGVEKDVGMDHWRPWYKWASSHTHANHRPADKLLGVSESRVPVNLVGASNSGFVDPFQMTALTLAELVGTYLGHSMNLDRIVHIEVINDLANQMASIALDTERTSRKRFEQGE